MTPTSILKTSDFSHLLDYNGQNIILKGSYLVCLEPKIANKIVLKGAKVTKEKCSQKHGKNFVYFVET